MVDINGCVWIGTAGLGLYVYRDHTNKPIGSWGVDRKCEIYTLLHISKTGFVLALTHEGMYTFDTSTGMSDSALLEHATFIPKDGVLDINEGVVIPETGSMREPEIWACARMGHGFSILHYEKLCVVDQVYTGDLEDKGRIVRHMQPVTVNGRSYLAVANRHIVECWDVIQRQKNSDFDVTIHCKGYCGGDSECVCVCVCV